MGGIEIDTATGSPLVDAYGRYSNINYFASGNLRYPLKTAVQCWREGRDMAPHVNTSLDAKLPDNWVQSRD